jgi:D-xylose transport system substrate-binding protein
MVKRTSLFAVVGVLVLALAACGSSKKSSTSSSTSGGSSTSSSGGGGGKGLKVALLLPESKTTRYEAADRPFFTQRLKQICPDCQLIYSNADQDANKQQTQAEAALTQGAKVLVLDPVDAGSAAAIVLRANQQKVPVVSYDRLLTGSKIDYYVSFDNQRVGQLQGTALTSALKAKGKSSGNIVMINGAPTDNNATQFKKGAHSVIDKSGYKVAKEYDTPDWSPDKAQTEMQQAITALGKTGFIGVYAANDGTAGGAVAAMKSAGLSPANIPITGQDAQVDAIQRILTDQQYMTVYKPVKPEAAAAAEAAVALGKGQTLPAALVKTQTDTGKGMVPSLLLTPIAVTKDKVKDTVIKDGYDTAAQVCTAAFKAACAKAGIQ